MFNSVRPLAALSVATFCIVASACSSDPNAIPDASSDPIKAVLKKVDETHPGNPWWSHVTAKVDDGLLADISFKTDYKSGDPEVKEFCEAVVDALGDDGALVNFYGVRTIESNEVDGSVSSEDQDVNLMNGTKKTGCTPGVFSGNVGAG